MKIYGWRTVGNPLRVALFLAEKGIDLDFEVVDIIAGEHRQPEFLQKNPLAQVPVLALDDGSCISESTAICRYFEGVHPEPPLMGVDSFDASVVEMWERRVEQLYSAVRAVFRHTSPAAAAVEPIQIAAWAELNRPEVGKMLKVIDTQLGLSPYVAGERYTIADMTMIFCLQMIERIDIPLSKCGENIERWHQLVTQRESVKSVLG